MLHTLISKPSLLGDLGNEGEQKTAESPHKPNSPPTNNFNSEQSEQNQICARLKEGLLTVHCLGGQREVCRCNSSCGIS